MSNFDHIIDDAAELVSRKTEIDRILDAMEAASGRSIVETAFKTKFNIIDAMMGIGKTNYLFKMIREDYKNDGMVRAAYDTAKKHFEEHSCGEVYRGPDKRQKYLIVVPYITEVKRFIKELPELELEEPEAVHGKKLNDLAILISHGENIVTTHALFELLTMEMCLRLRSYNYMLIIDETIKTVEEYKKLKPADKNLILNANWIRRDPNTNRLHWNTDVYNDNNAEIRGRFSDVQALCETGSLVLIKDTMLLWEFPVEFIKCFKTVWLATYMFICSPFYSYLKMNNFDMEFFTIKDKKCVPMKGSGTDEAALKEELRPLVHLYEGGGSQTKPVGRNEDLSMYSVSWYERNDKITDALKAVGKSTSNFFRNVTNATWDKIGWTTWKPYLSKIADTGFKKNS